MKVFFDLACMSTCCWGLPKPKYEPFIFHNRGILIKKEPLHSKEPKRAVSVWMCANIIPLWAVWNLFLLLIDVSISVICSRIRRNNLSWVKFSRKHWHTDVWRKRMSNCNVWIRNKIIVAYSNFLTVYVKFGSLLFS